MPKYIVKQLAIIILLISLCINLSAQPFIDVYLSSLTPESRGPAFSAIEETHEIHVPHKDTPTILYVNRTYNSKGKIQQEVKKNSVGGKSSETKWEYTPTGSLKKISNQTFVNMKGWISEDIELIYNDSTGYIEDIVKSFEHKVRSKGHITCNETGFPIDVQIVNSGSVLIGIERIITIPASNCIRVLCFTAAEQFQSSHNYPIDYHKPIPKSNLKREYNEQGDVVLESLKQASVINQGYYYEYEYDSYNNWIEKRTFQCEISSKNKAKNKKLEYKVIRKIRY